jgi:hypothetical protein
VQTSGATNGDLISFDSSDNIWKYTKTLTGNYEITSGLTVNTLSATSISATTYYGDGSNLTGLITTDVFVTGGTYSNGTATFTNNTGDTFTVTGFTSTGVTLGSFGITIDGSGSSITPGLKNYLSLPYNGYITGYVIIADQSGSTSIDIWKDNYGSFPPTSGDSITGGNYPSLSSQQINQDTTLSGWTTNFSVGDIICFNVISATTVTRINLTINVTKT